VYAPGTTQNFAAVIGRFRWGQPGRYLYDLTPHLLDTAQLPDGSYRFVVTASDTRGNSGSKAVVIRIHQRPAPALRPLLDARCEPR
jgi:hypothetical protein